MGSPPVFGSANLQTGIKNCEGALAILLLYSERILVIIL